MQKEDYAEIKDVIEKAGYFTTLHPHGDDEDVGWFLVLVSRCTKGRLHGNSFRLSKEDDGWHLITWTPVEYLIPAGADLTALCLECLRASATPISVVPPELVIRHGLIQLPEMKNDQR